eukprot:Gb_16446 [translate_table: standard]
MLAFNTKNCIARAARKNGNSSNLITISVIVGIARRENLVVLVPSRRGVPAIVGEILLLFNVISRHVESDRLHKLLCLQSKPWEILQMNDLPGPSDGTGQR